MDKEKKQRKPRKVTKFFEVKPKGSAESRRKTPKTDWEYQLVLVTKIGKRRWSMPINSLDDTDQEILLHQFLRADLGRVRFTREELPGVSIETLLDALPLARKLRETYLKKEDKNP